MKKIYIKPEMCVIEMETAQLIAASNLFNFEGTGEGNGVLGETEASGDAMAKGHSSNLWDDDDDI
ncbi:MAG: hypothetical protein ACI4TW_04075 [Prevotella sp.]